MERSRDLLTVEFVREAVSVRAWAFAADYIRLHALLHEGGIYLDSDVEVFRPFDAFLHHSAFSSVEHWPSVNGLGIEGAVVGAEKGHPWISQCLEYYENRRFSEGEGAREQFIVSGILARAAAKGFGFCFKAESQELAAGIHIYSPVVFTHVGGQYSASETYALHHCSGSWREPTHREKLRAKIKGVFSGDAFRGA
jgi:mannosyltransferase OCH1-like enzyme